ncbi:tetratricopeptide repeat protein [Microbulbifer elongatus]|uniref:Tetratricopeptide repeat protein n=1 Tax=Microbulbifer elongatus TaxID=86173 RepID=A0ABT1P0R4_9GAMM|nr:tetratricopeptide repeat protein [Microbulbifer elongatus]MCQ3828724.1 tetratricopeptide repeat protein [Microbulbifer elongatus]
MRWIAWFTCVLLVGCATDPWSPESTDAVEDGSQGDASPGRGITTLTQLDPLWPEGPPAAPGPRLAPALLALSPEMQAFVDDVDPSQSPNRRFRQILRTLKQDRFYLEYDLDTTATAAEAFAHRRGNCISFAALIVALARAVGVPAHFNRVEAPRERRTTRGGDGRMLVQNILHINAEVSFGWSTQIIELNFEPRSRYRHTRLTDEEVASLYLNNLATDKARAGKLTDALPVLREALTLTPDSSIVWNTLGYLYRQQGKLELAAMSYTQALSLDKRNTAAKNNLKRVYALQSQQALSRARTRDDQDKES